MSNISNNTLINELQKLISTAQQKAIKAVDFQRVVLYWQIGEKIFNEIQKQKTRADYGKKLIKTLSNELEPKYGSGYSYRQLYLFLQFYKVFPIVNTLYSQLSWSHYKLLIRIDDADKREFYIAETIKNLWSVNLGQLQMYVNYFDRSEKEDFENPTIGVLLCSDKNDMVVEYSLPKENKTILASKYELYLPNKDELIKELKKELS